jgi:hypothetical protein
MAEDVEARRCEAGCGQIPPEPPVERAARDPTGPGSRLPERLARVHRREVLASICERSQDRRIGGVGELATAPLPALAAVAVEDGLALEAEITGGEADDLGPAAAGQDKDQQDRPVPPATHGVRHDGEQSTDLVGVVAPGDRGDGAWPFEGIAGVPGEQTHPDREAVEGTETGDPGANRRR